MMTVFIFLYTFILTYTHWVNAQHHYQPHEINYGSYSGSSLESSKPTTNYVTTDKTKNINRNVNVVLNVNSEEVAQRLWKIIQENLSKNPNKQLSIGTQQELEKAITPVMSNTRRGLSSIPISKIRSQLENITRKALVKDDPKSSAVDREIMTMNIVANMMKTLKKSVPSKPKKSKIVPSKRILLEANSEKSQEKSENNQYATLEVKIRPADIVKIIRLA